MFGFGGILGLGGQGGCDRRIKVFVIIQNNNNWGVGGRVGGVWSGSRGGVRVDVNEELKFLRKFTKKSGGGGVGRWVRWGSGWM